MSNEAQKCHNRQCSGIDITRVEWPARPIMPLMLYVPMCKARETSVEKPVVKPPSSNNDQVRARNKDGRIKR